MNRKLEFGLLVGGMCVCALLVTVSQRNREPAKATAIGLDAELASSPPDLRGDAALVSEQDPEGVEREASPTAPGSTPSEAAGRASGFTPERLGSASLAELQREYKRLLRASSELQGQLFARAWESGSYTNFAVDYIGLDLQMENLRAGAQGAGELYTERIHEPRPGVKEWQFASLRRADHPALYDMLDERDQIQAELDAREAAAKSAAATGAK